MARGADGARGARSRWPRAARRRSRRRSPARLTARAAHAQAGAHRPVALQRHRQRLLRRDPAPRPAVADADVRRAVGRASSSGCSRRPSATLTEWRDALIAETGDGFPEKVTAFRPGHARPRPVRPAVPGVRHAGAADSLCRQRSQLLPDLPDRAAGCSPTAGCHACSRATGRGPSRSSSGASATRCTAWLTRLRAADCRRPGLRGVRQRRGLHAHQPFDVEAGATRQRQRLGQRRFVEGDRSREHRQPLVVRARRPRTTSAASSCPQDPEVAPDRRQPVEDRRRETWPATGRRRPTPAGGRCAPPRPTPCGSGCSASPSTSDAVSTASVRVADASPLPPRPVASRSRTRCPLSADSGATDPQGRRRAGCPPRPTAPPRP